MCVEPEEGVEPPSGGSVLPVAVPQVPLAHRVRAVAALLQSLANIGNSSIEGLKEP